MRDPERIALVLGATEREWRNVADQRLGQFLINLTRTNMRHAEAGSDFEQVLTRLFNLEDGQLVEWLGPSGAAEARFIDEDRVRPRAFLAHGGRAPAQPTTTGREAMADAAALKDTYDRGDLLDAWLAYEANRNAHPDIADYFYRRFWAFTHAFGAWEPWFEHWQAPRDRRQVWRLFSDCLVKHNATVGPWGIYLAGSPDERRAGVEARHLAAIDDACEHLRERYRLMLLDLMEQIWDLPADASISIAQLREEGFDPAAPIPSFDTYM